MTEIKDIRGYEELYSISSKGEVWSKKSNRCLKPYSSGTDGKYLRVTLYKDKRLKRYRVHWLVADTFIENINNLKSIDHLDRNPKNNNKENLRWCTNSQNQQNKDKVSCLSTSKYKGVHWESKKKVWKARITVNYKIIHLGSFNYEKDAAKAYNLASKKFYGEYAYKNKL